MNPAHPVTDLTAAELERRLADGEPLSVVDVRSPADFARGHIAGAVNAPAPWKERPSLPEGDVVVACYGGVINRALSRRLAAAGRPGVHRLKGGMAAWEGAIARTPGVDPGWGVDRRLRLIAGAIVLVTAALGAFASPWFLLGTGFVGFNLVLGGLFNWCPMLVYFRGIGLR